MPTSKRSMRLRPIYGPVGLLALAWIALVLTGCSDGRPNRVQVSGHVTVDGKPLKFGGVAFKPTAGGRMAGGSVKKGGSYSVNMYELNDGLPLGSYAVSVSSAQRINDVSQRWHAPQKYANTKTSGLVVKISETTTELDFDLTWEGDEHSGPWVEEWVEEF